MVSGSPHWGVDQILLGQREGLTRAPLALNNAACLSVTALSHWLTAAPSDGQPTLPPSARLSTVTTLLSIVTTFLSEGKRFEAFHLHLPSFHGDMSHVEALSEEQRHVQDLLSCHTAASDIHG